MRAVVSIHTICFAVYFDEATLNNKSYARIEKGSVCDRAVRIVDTNAKYAMY